MFQHDFILNQRAAAWRGGGGSSGGGGRLPSEIHNIMFGE